MSPHRQSEALGESRYKPPTNTSIHAAAHTEQHTAVQEAQEEGAVRSGQVRSERFVTTFLFHTWPSVPLFVRSRFFIDCAAL